MCSSLSGYFRKLLGQALRFVVYLIRGYRLVDIVLLEMSCGRIVPLSGRAVEVPVQQGGLG